MLDARRICFPNQTQGDAAVLCAVCCLGRVLTTRCIGSLLYLSRHFQEEGALDSVEELPCHAILGTKHVKQKIWLMVLMVSHGFTIG